jgi:uncharacterized membrane protein
LVKAASGTTLSPREARTLRRTAKDLVTAVPVVVILLVPLTPVQDQKAVMVAFFFLDNKIYVACNFSPYAFFIIFFSRVARSSHCSPFL